MEKQKTEKPKQKKVKVSDGPKSESPIIAVIRISGKVGVPKDIENVLYRLRLRKKYVCVVIDSKNESLIGLINRVKYYIAYGEITRETYEKLVKARGKKVNGVLNPFFRLHPPRGGINSKLQYPKGVLGNNKDDINKLIEKML